MVGSLDGVKDRAKLGLQGALFVSSQVSSPVFSGNMGPGTTTVERPTFSSVYPSGSLLSAYHIPVNHQFKRQITMPAPQFAANRPKEIRLADYKPPVYLVPKTDLTFELVSEDEVVVTSKLLVSQNPNAKTKAKQMPKLILDGAPAKVPTGSQMPTMELLSLKVNGKELEPTAYTRRGARLVIDQPPASPFTVEVKTRVNPKTNRSLSGLYTSGGTLTSQCEAEGFRNMTFYPDRPDVMSEYTTTVIAPPGKYTRLLSNGNPAERVTLPDGREQMRWHDPFGKPTYLFALVAGNLACREETFVTKSGRPVTLQIFVDPGNDAKSAHAMTSLKQVMAWDEERWGLEYDLDLFQIVAVRDFNFGAMENKGLNIFKASLILASPETATDSSYDSIRQVVGHEYAHNWTGNRVTCRDWFQLSLKEGLTVFRDQEFMMDYQSRVVQRIEDVTHVRTAQFKEDAGAMAHPIRPAAVAEIDNFYTNTIYYKGAEVIRMLHTLLGEQTFRRGMDRYFERFDGQAVTTEDFVQVMREVYAEASPGADDLKQFEATWYNQAGTPTVHVTDAYDPQAKTYRLTLKQSTPATPGQSTKAPFHIPVRVGLLDSQGRDLPLTLQSTQQGLLTNGDILNLKEAETTFVFENVPEKPVPSLLRNWSAPVKLDYDYDRNTLCFLMAHDRDGFNRWEATQLFMVDVLKEIIENHQRKHIQVDQRLITSLETILTDPKLDPLLVAKTLTLPSASYLAELYPDGKVDVEAIDAALKQVRATIGRKLEKPLLEAFEQNRASEQRPYQWVAEDVGERAIKNMALRYLVTALPERYLRLAQAQFERRHNMTDIRESFALILDVADSEARELCADAFYQHYKDDPLVVAQWFSDLALADHPGVSAQVKALTEHPAYDKEQPGMVNALVGGFAENAVHFHQKDGSGYAFLADQVIAADRFNPTLASGLAQRFTTILKFDQERQALMKAQLERIQQNSRSKHVLEVVGKTLDLVNPQPAS